ncbi:MAG: hypothetical protein AB7V46_18305 [Thermomicrobiales bacterium]
MSRWLALFLLLPSALWGTNFYVTVSGLGGEPDYEQRFTAYAQDLDKILKEAGGGSRVETLHGAAATRDRLTSVLNGISASAKPADALVIMLIGHGTYDGTNYKMNLPGKDISASEVGALLDKIPASRQLVVNMTSASGASLDVLKKEGRVVITATRAGTEKNATVFARYWVEALRDAAADVDKNQMVSALEAFRYADEKTAKFYETQKRLATEHALLEDTGKGEGVRAPAPENGSGLQASRFALLRLGAAQIAANTPEKRALLERKEELEQQIDKLKYEKAAMPITEYKQQLTQLLIELAKTQAELEK